MILVGRDFQCRKSEGNAGRHHVFWEGSRATTNGRLYQTQAWICYNPSSRDWCTLPLWVPLGPASYLSMLVWWWFPYNELPFTNLPSLDLSTKINASHLNVDMLLGKYIPNLIANPFDVSREYTQIIKLPCRNWIRFQEVGTGQMG